MRIKNLNEPPIGIILTMPKAFFEDRKMSEEQFKKVFERAMRRKDTVWYFKKTSLPLLDFAFVYIVFGGKVQYKTNFVCYERNKEMRFEDAGDGKLRFFPKTNWIVLTGPVVPAPNDIPMKGFQGFRYVIKELF